MNGIRWKFKLIAYRFLEVFGHRLAGSSTQLSGDNEEEPGGKEGSACGRHILAQTSHQGNPKIGSIQFHK
jgi:hypothetical protein